MAGRFARKKKLYGGPSLALAVKLSMFLHPLGLVYHMATNRRTMHLIVDSVMVWFCTCEYSQFAAVDARFHAVLY